MKNKLFILLLLFFSYLVPKNAFAADLNLPNVTLTPSEGTEIKSYDNFIQSNFSAYDNINIENLTGSTSEDYSLISMCSNLNLQSCSNVRFRLMNSSLAIPYNQSLTTIKLKFASGLFSFSTDKKYSLLVQISKTNDATFHRDFDVSTDNQTDDLKDISLDVSVHRQGYSNKYSLNDMFSYYHVRFFRDPLDENMAYLLLEFEVSQYSFTLEQANYSIEYFGFGTIPYWISTPSVSGNSTFKINSVSLLQDSSISFVGDDVDPDNPDPGPGNQDIINNITDSTNKLLEKQEENTQAIKDLTDSINDDNIDNAQNNASDFFNKFDENNHGLSGLINAPLNFLNNLTTAVCEPLKFNLPFVDYEVVLPCMKSIYQQYFGVFFTLYQMLTTGLISYAVGIRLFAKVKALQDPQNDKLEVFSL